ncbi:MAG: RluA family pseudouridine synthase [Planctomycetia bacterium]|nr:RluA family pseudouridine synthase [Planctomycetia bacterium]
MPVKELQKDNIIYEDNHLLVVNKQPGCATMGLPEGETTLLTLAKDYIKHKYHKKGNVYLGVVSRLDVPVSGVVVFARTSKAADRLNEQFRQHSTQKIYWAIVEGLIYPLDDDCIDFICEDPRHRKMWITKQADSSNNAKEAKLHYRRLERLGTNSLIEVQLETGRKHQIRLQLSHRGYPIIGDRKYGSKVILPEGTGIALHGKSLTILHPTTGQEITFEAKIPAFWSSFLS